STLLFKPFKFIIFLSLIILLSFISIIFNELLSFNLYFVNTFIFSFFIIVKSNLTLSKSSIFTSNFISLSIVNSSFVLFFITNFKLHIKSSAYVYSILFKLKVLLDNIILFIIFIILYYKLTRIITIFFNFFN